LGEGWYRYTRTLITKSSIPIEERIRVQTVSINANSAVDFDNFSIHPVGCVADWTFDGTYNDATVNGNDLTEQGTGNEFVYEDPLRVRAEGGTAKVRLVPFHKSLQMDGNGWAEISDADQVGLDIGTADFFQTILFKCDYASYFLHFGTKRDHVPALGYQWFMEPSSDDGRILLRLYDGDTERTVVSTQRYDDGRWHTALGFCDRDGNSVQYVDGSQDGWADCSAFDGVDLSNSDDFGIAEWMGQKAAMTVARKMFFNLGYQGLSTWASYHGLTIAEAESTFAARIYRRPYASLSELGFSELEMAESFGTEKVTDGGFESWTGDTPDNWVEHNESAGVRDIVDETTTVHSGGHAIKLQATGNDGTTFWVRQVYTLEVGKMYEVVVYRHYASRTEGITRVIIKDSNYKKIAIDEKTSVTSDYEEVRLTFIVPNNPIRLDLMLVGETNGTVYFDDASMHPVGCVADWTFDNTYNDATVNANHLTEQGTGNQFVRIAPR